jgi:hypothetical protein
MAAPATPTLPSGRIHAFGATGMLNTLDARTGAVIWSLNVASDTKRGVPTWGASFSGPDAPVQTARTGVVYRSARRYFCCDLMRLCAS